MTSPDDRRLKLTLARAQLHALKLAVASGLGPPAPVPEHLVSAFHDALVELDKSHVAPASNFRVREEELLWIRIGRRGLFRAPIHARFVGRTFTARLAAALFYCELVWEELYGKEETRPVVGFAQSAQTGATTGE